MTITKCTRVGILLGGFAFAMIGLFNLIESVSVSGGAFLAVGIGLMFVGRRALSESASSCPVESEHENPRP
ncbi:MAG: hypothetical protein U9Q81_22760 [Pseudomonadota bacterium]|nr:hypothetical protein [Pseudomonadota bacterium]